MACVGLSFLFKTEHRPRVCMDPILFIPPVKEPRLLEDHFAQILKRAGGARTPVSSWQPADLSSFNFKLIKQVPYVHHRFLLKPSPALGLTTWGHGNVPSLTFSEESLRTLWRAHCRTAHLSLPPSTTCHFHASLSTLRKPSPSPPLHQNSAL